MSKSRRKESTEAGPRASLAAAVFLEPESGTIRGGLVGRLFTAIEQLSDDDVARATKAVEALRDERAIAAALRAHRAESEHAHAG